MKFIDPTSTKILYWIIRFVAFVVGLSLIPWGLWGLMLAGCHDSGGFCAGSLNLGYYVIGTGCVLSGIALLVWAFTTRWQKVKTALIVSATVIVLLIFFAESRN